MNKLISKLISLILISSLSWLALAAIGHTFAFFSNTDNSSNNVFLAGSLDISLDPHDLPDVSLNQIIDLDLHHEGSLIFQYRLKIETDDSDFCNHLELTASSTDDVYYGQLKNFSGATTTISDLTDSWEFKISDPDNRPQGQVCNFNFIFQAWQIDQENYDVSVGFSDVEVASGQVASGQPASTPIVQVIVPNGGEEWWVGRIYEITWLATNPLGQDDDLKIDLYYSADSGHSWGLVVSGIDNTGSYWWRVSLFLENFTYWVPSPTARIKVVAYDPSNPSIVSEDISDEDYCPPIDYGLLTPQEIAWLESVGLMFNYLSPPGPQSQLPSSGSATPELPSTDLEPEDEIDKETLHALPLDEVDQEPANQDPDQLNILINDDQPAEPLEEDEIIGEGEEIGDEAEALELETPLSDIDDVSLPVFDSSDQLDSQDEPEEDNQEIPAVQPPAAQDIEPVLDESEDATLPEEIPAEPDSLGITEEQPWPEEAGDASF